MVVEQRHGLIGGASTATPNRFTTSFLRQFLLRQGSRPLGGGRHIIDVLAEKDGRRFLVSLKWQQSSGTAEQNVPFEVLCLAECLRADDLSASPTR